MIEALLLIGVLGFMVTLLLATKRASTALKGQSLGILSQKGYEKSEGNAAAVKEKKRA